MQRTVRKLLRAVANYDPDYYDMYADRNEACFAQLYVERILRCAQAAGIGPPARLLEAGCQAGRLAVPLAKLGFEVTGIDTSGFGLRRARGHLNAAGVEATLVQGDLVNVLGDHPQWQFDVVVCAEVVYLSQRYGAMVEALAKAVRPGGLLCVSHRPKLYYLIEALKRHDLTAASGVLSRSEGPFGDSAYYNWQTEAELKALYRAAGMRWVGLHPIDRFAWLTGLSPGSLDGAQRAQWLSLEMGCPDDTGMCARYMLVVTTRPAGPEDGCNREA